MTHKKLKFLGNVLAHAIYGTESETTDMKGKRSKIKVEGTTITSLLNSQRIEDGRGLGEAFAEAKATFTSLREKANLILEQDELAIVFAQSRAKRPSARLTLTESGDPTFVFARRPAKGTDKPAKDSSPSLKDLREQAKQLGIDTTAMGRQKSKIAEAIAARSAGKKAKPAA